MDNFEDWRKSYVENAYYFRGKYIDTFNRLEKTIENYLIGYFGMQGSKVNEFANIILDRLNFESKKEAFNAIMNQKSKEDGFVKTGGNSYPHSKLFKDISEVQMERNAFAHYYLITPVEPNMTIITLAESRDSIKYHGYTSDEYVSLLDKIDRLTLEVYDLFDSLPERFRY